MEQVNKKTDVRKMMEKAVSVMKDSISEQREDRTEFRVRTF